MTMTLIVSWLYDRLFANDPEDIGKTALAKLPVIPFSPSGDVLNSMLNELAMEPPLVIVLDDYHLITDSHVHEIMRYLIDKFHKHTFGNHHS